MQSRGTAGYNLSAIYHLKKRRMSRGRTSDNVVEIAIRLLALNRKNALFAGHDEGPKAWTRIASLVETAKRIQVNHANLKLEAWWRSHRLRLFGDIVQINVRLSGEMEELS